MNFDIRNILTFNRKYKSYHIYLIHTSVSCNLFLWENWQHLFPLVDRLVDLTTQPAYIRTFQAYPSENKWLGFGRMKWSKENNIKWSTKHLGNKPAQDRPDFFKTEIWAPDWNVVCDTDLPPDVYVSLYHYPDIHMLREGILIALPRSLYLKKQVLVDEILTQLVALIPGAKLSLAKRDWWGRTAKRNNMEDINPQELEKIIHGF